MALSGGADRALLRPIQHDETLRGCHVGSSAALNVRHPQAGCAYYYESSKPGRLLSQLNAGWEIVRSTDPEEWGADLPPDVQREIDTVKAFKDVVLLRCPVEKYREIKEKKAEYNRAVQGSAESDYLSKGERMRARFGNAAPDGDLYFKRSYHSGG